MTHGHPWIETPRLLLDAFHLTDAEHVKVLVGDREVSRYTLRIPHPYTLEAAVEWVGARAQEYAQRREVTFAIRLRSTGQLAGSIGLRLEEAHRRAELGFVLGREFWGKGYATEAAGACVAFAFERLGLNKVHACHFAVNLASGRVLEKIGMRRDGVLRQHYVRDGACHDSVEYSILRSEHAEGDGRKG